MNKITILPGASANLSEASFAIHDETHTLGNPLRWMIMKNPKVEFCGYSAPHPSENKIHLRIQMYDNESSLTALIEALEALDGVCGVLEEKYEDATKRWDPKVYAEASERWKPAADT
ncbi:RNA polymerase subunit AC19 [Serendipita sp. 396]|nr:RNA polymerase subunit AC19 [Serendipita sp. 396]KAG8793895.1 RNA polymerase subunit AC19 [Serendipita sp. 398]KAG8846871.1 RNA polymerase subunit AC19 [Serendipita sp. 411]KAG8850872.1 RNA polymerase subunit AC19 [Serendipita sp. 405]